MLSTNKTIIILNPSKKMEIKFKNYNLYKYEIVVYKYKKHVKDRSLSCNIWNTAPVTGVSCFFLRWTVLDTKCVFIKLW